MKIFYLILLAIATLILLVLFIDVLIGFLIYKKIFYRKGKFRKKFEKVYKPYESDLKTFDNMEKLSILSKDDLTLKGLYKNNDSKKIVILVHGFGQNKYMLLQWIKLFESLGFDQLVIDLRSHGESEGDEITLGYDESDDILRWIDEAKSIKSDYKIILFGLGIGGAIASTVLKYDVKNLKAIICDSCYDNTLKQIKYLNSHKKVKNKLIFNIFSNYLKRNKKINLKELDINQNLKQSKLPVLILHGKNDNITPVEMAYNLYTSLPEKLGQINVFEGAGHFESLTNNKYLYKNQIKSFLLKYNL